MLALAAAGVRAFRINLYRGGNLDEIKLAPRFAALAGWHLEVYLDGCDLPELAPRLRTAPRLVIDHLGMTRAGVPKALRAISDVNPAALLFGSDLPGTRAKRPFERADIELVREAAGPRALHDNALALYASVN